MRDTILTEEDRARLSLIAADIESGNHLLRGRPEGYKACLREFCEAVNADEPTQRQLDMREYVRQCADYRYWNNLPDEERFF